MTRLAQAARNARFLLAVYGQFGKPMPIACAETVMRELTEALEECDAEGEAELQMERRVNRCLGRGKPELVRVPGQKMYADPIEWSSQ